MSNKDLSNSIEQVRIHDIKNEVILLKTVSLMKYTDIYPSVAEWSKTVSLVN